MVPAPREFTAPAGTRLGAKPCLGSMVPAPREFTAPAGTRLGAKPCLGSIVLAPREFTAPAGTRLGAKPCLGEMAPAPGWLLTTVTRGRRPLEVGVAPLMTPSAAPSPAGAARPAATP